MSLIRHAATLLTAFGALQSVAGLLAVRAFAARPIQHPGALPPVTVLKPMCGHEPLLEEAVASFCRQDYPDYQLVIGVQDPADPALETARRVKARFPHRDITIVVDASRHGTNGKVANLINMLPAARHDVLVIADSDMHVRPDYLLRVVAALQQPGTGLVTTLACGEPAARGIAARLGAMHLSYIFLPGALLAVALGRQDCLGGTMALTRETLTRIGGLPALVCHLADDNVLGSLIHRLGLAIRLADTLPVMTVQERSLGALWQHELRWMRTISALVPVAFSASVLQFPLFWAGLAVFLSGFTWPAIAAFAAAWCLRALVAQGIDHALRPLRARPAPTMPAWRYPLHLLRDILSVAEMAASYWSDAVTWRGRTLHADRGPPTKTMVPVLAKEETLVA